VVLAYKKQKVALI